VIAERYPANDISLTLPARSAIYPDIGNTINPAKGLSELINPICADSPPKARM
jgi:hypothetical protein